MTKNLYFIALLMAILFGIALLGLGILIGRLWLQPRVLLVNASEGVTVAEAEGQWEQQITVQGVGIVKAEPTIARLYLGIQICDPNASKANQEVNIRLAEVIKRMQDLGVPEENIIPSDFSLYPSHYTVDNRAVSVFCAANELWITTDQLDRIGDLIDRAIEAGVTNVYRVAFTVTDTEPIREQAIHLAYTNARKQAEQMGQLLGQKSIRITHISVDVVDNLSNYVAGYRGGGGDVAPQEGTIRATVTLVCVPGN